MAKDKSGEKDRTGPLTLGWWKWYFLLPFRMLLLGGLLVGIPISAAARATLMWLSNPQWGQWRGGTPGHRRPEESPDWAPEHFDVVCLSHVAWTHIWQRNHHTMTRLAQGHRVAYLQVLVTSYAHIFARLSPAVIPNLFVRHEAVRLRQPLLLPGDSRLGFIRRFNNWKLAVDVRWNARQMGMNEPPVLWFYHPSPVGVLDYLKPSAIVYDIQDEYSAFKSASKGVVERERRLIDASDVIFGGTHELYQKKTVGFNGFAKFYPCAVEFDHFNQTAPVALGDSHGRRNVHFPLPKQFRMSKRPRLLYTGLIDGRIDAELIEALADANPDWHIMMIGPVEGGSFPIQRVVENRKNVWFTGRVDYKYLPEFFAHSDVCLMPWKVNELTLHINPTKTLEYLASGLPVVSVKLPDLEAFFSNEVALSDGGNHEQFIQLVRDALAGKFTDKVKLGLERARSFAWETVVPEMAGHVGDAVRKRREVGAPTAPDRE